ncbi:MAG: type II secretion system protein [Planctomycetota bacterium]|nr:type II secretion system protein [Planctomycetota bacterium]
MLKRARMHNRSLGGSRRVNAARGFSLIESVLALAILAITFTAIASAIGAGTSSALEQRDQVTATLATEELLAVILGAHWDELPSWDGFAEDPGESRAPDGSPTPSRARIWRSASVIDHTLQLEPAGRELEGRMVRITTRSQAGRVLMSVERFIPEPNAVIQ